MAPARPEMIFVRGPQQGERAILMANVALVGRSPAADIHLMEQTASREQMQFELSPHGWIMVNLSANGTLINGRRFKKRKQVLLETGDVLGVGVETEILYVAPGDDPEEALAAWREENPPEETHARMPPAEAAGGEAAAPATGPDQPPLPGKGDAGAAEGEPAEKPARRRWRKAKEAPAEQPEQREQLETELEVPPKESSKVLRIALGAAIAGGLGLLALALILRAGGNEDTSPVDEGPPRLTAEQIREALAEPITRTPSVTKAAEALDRARRSYSNRNLWEPGDLYRCVRDYKLHKAYKYSRSFDQIADLRNFEQASRELQDLVVTKYDAAWTYERARSYRSAKTLFEEFLAILPMADLDRGEPAREVIMANVIDHLNFIKKKLATKKYE